MCNAKKHLKSHGFFAKRNKIFVKTFIKADYLDTNILPAFNRLLGFKSTASKVIWFDSIAAFFRVHVKNFVYYGRKYFQWNEEKK